ncbi:MAG TPA: biotin synthase BioB [Archaeoglobaceae archaeon]|nr:biotin synthase BioB [Archaeoglobaceae archaeon]
MSLLRLLKQAEEVRKKYLGSRLELCSIINAKSGLCTQDCKFCAQSLHHSTQIETYPLKEEEEIIQVAQRAKQMGAERFGIVTSGRSLSWQELKKVARSITRIKKEVKIETCASLGSLDEEGLFLLKQSGLTRYHHNIETSPSYFPQIVSTHSFKERIQTVQNAKKVGLEVCSGGIIGMGESWQDRIEMAFLLKELEVNSVPINILVAIKGTALENLEPLSCLDAIRSIAIFRIILKDKIIKIAAGRETVLKDFQALGFMAGANGMLIGGYLTIKGRPVEEDWKLIQEVKRIWSE